MNTPKGQWIDRPQVERLRHGHIIVIIGINLVHLFYRTIICRSIRAGFIVYHISFTSSAFDDAAWFRKHDQVIIFDGIDRQLTYQPNIETRNRKRLRPNQTAEWELRIDRFRIFYDVNDGAQSVEIKMIGQKTGNRIYVRGKEYNL